MSQLTSSLSLWFSPSMRLNRPVVQSCIFSNTFSISVLFPKHTRGGKNFLINLPLTHHSSAYADFYELRNAYDVSGLLSSTPSSGSRQEKFWRTFSTELCQLCRAFSRFSQSETHIVSGRLIEASNFETEESICPRSEVICL